MLKWAGARWRLWALAMGVCVLLLPGCDSMFYYPDRINHVPPERLGIEYRDYFFPNSRGEKLHGRLHFHSKDREYQGLFVVFHGNAENLTSHYLGFSWVLK